MGQEVWAWGSLVALGFFHGLNPAMGWLFAVALGLQERRLSAVFRALVPIALGHAGAVGVVAIAAALLGATLPRPVVLTGAGAVLLLFTGWRIWRRTRHPRTRFRANALQLALWSFLMATAHGAGLMLAPVIAALTPQTPPMSEHSLHLPSQSLTLGILAVAVHTLAMFSAMTLTALVVYRELGVQILNRAWFNVDLVWIVVLAGTGLITFGAGLYGLVR
ncbi:hypothetical protein OO015_08610 [Thermomicrobium sp. 4228-Ro]|uniref:hypothetical protein n=1 Tax=Thermomicrobium sp. 4228-Ro TaxID=2993937 RepID=UPI002248979F|nr:hypothetical protein [Thermomicrobium sp. 4228-Ro]MCX2727554.1 hypothetical protein [Thermomicrobium sp. 4228-Ro]